MDLVQDKLVHLISKIRQDFGLFRCQEGEELAVPATLFLLLDSGKMKIHLIEDLVTHYIADRKLRGLREKDMTPGEMLREIIPQVRADQSVVATLFVTEAYALRVKSGTREADMARDGDLRLKDHPERHEILGFSSETRKGLKVFCSYHIDPDPDAGNHRRKLGDLLQSTSQGKTDDGSPPAIGGKCIGFFEDN